MPARGCTLAHIAPPQQNLTLARAFSLDPATNFGAVGGAQASQATKIIRPELRLTGRHTGTGPGALARARVYAGVELDGDGESALPQDAGERAAA